jgi:hypothetical protein
MEDHMNSEAITQEAIRLGIRNPHEHVLNAAGTACEDGTSCAGAVPCPGCLWSEHELPAIVGARIAAAEGRGTFAVLPWSALTILLLAVTLVISGCGTPKTVSNSGSSLPSIAGNWSGTINLQGSTPNLSLVLTEDAAGNLTGTASSTSGCNFSVPVTGAIYANYTFSVQAADPTTLLLAGNLANNNVDAQGSINLGNGTDCGPANGAPFALGRQ